jgi:hypothetical protein
VKSPGYADADADADAVADVDADPDLAGRDGVRPETWPRLAASRRPRTRRSRRRSERMASP